MAAKLCTECGDFHEACMNEAVLAERDEHRADEEQRQFDDLLHELRSTYLPNYT